MREGASDLLGDDWAEDHHDVELVDEDGRRLVRGRLPEGLEGIARLHELIAAQMPASWAELEPADVAGRVRIGIETDRGGWVQALVVAGYQVYAINPMSVARYRERHSTSGAKSDAGGCWPMLVTSAKRDATRLSMTCSMPVPRGRRSWCQWA